MSRIIYKDTVMIHVKSEREFKENASKFAKKMGISLSALVRMAVVEFMKKHKFVS